MKTLDELAHIAEIYHSERNADYRTTRIHSYQFIDMYIDWFTESRFLFSEYFDESDKDYSDFISYSTDGNGHVLSGNFTRQYPLFKILAHKIETNTISKKITNTKSETNKCFIIHGHNNTLKLEVARLIEQELEKETIILHEKVNQGRTIIEKFESHSQVDFAVALWTSDDEGKPKGNNDLQPRARQNVILETGYFFGLLGRHKVIILHEEGVEIPSDYNGLIYISISGNWKHDLLQEIKSMYK
jgi:predicted nucleotide-binding protein